MTVGGSVAEFMSMTATERLAVLGATLAAVGARTPVIASVGGELSGAVAEAAESIEVGAQAIMVHQPLNPFRSSDGWVAYQRAVAAAAAPAPVVLYVRDGAVGREQLSELAASSPNVVGVKYAVPDPITLATLTDALGERLIWSCGLAEKWAPFAWQAGATGFTSGLINLADEVPLALLDALRAGDLPATRRAWRVAAAFEDLRARRGGAASVGVVKHSLVAAGVIASPAVRAPLGQLDGTEKAMLERWG